MPRQELRRRVRALLTSHDGLRVDRFTDAAVARLDRIALRHWRSLDEFCLSYEETVKQRTSVLRDEGNQQETR